MFSTHKHATIIVGAIMAISCATPSGAQSNTSLGTVIDVTLPYTGCMTNAVGDGVTNNYDAFSCRLGKFTSAGGVLFVPAGTFKISPSMTSITPVNVPANVTIQGTGLSSILSQPSTATQKFLILHQYSGLKDIQIIQQQPTPSASWTPNATYDWQVWVVGSGVNIQNVMLLNPYLGILMSSDQMFGAIGEVQVNNLRGQPLKYGLMADRMCDVSRFDDIHFWPFWSFNALHSPYDSVVQAWTNANGYAFILDRVDNPQFSNIFAYRYSVGLLFSSSASEGTGDLCYGVSSRARFSGFDCDACNLGVDIVADGVNGVAMTNVDINAGSLSPINVQGDSDSAVFTNLDAVGSQVNVVNVTGDYDSIVVGDSLVRSWNINSSGFPAFQVAPGATGSVISVSNTLYNNGHGGAVAGGTTVITNAVNSAPGLQ